VCLNSVDREEVTLILREVYAMKTPRTLKQKYYHTNNFFISNFTLSPTNREDWFSGRRHFYLEIVYHLRNILTSALNEMAEVLLYNRCRVTCFNGGCSGNGLSTVCSGRVELNIDVLPQRVQGI